MAYVADERTTGYQPHFLLGPPRIIGQTRMPDFRSAGRRRREIQEALHAFAVEYREQPTARAKALVGEILRDAQEPIPPGIVRRTESMAQAVAGAWRVLAFGAELRTIDQASAWYAWLVNPVQHPYSWLSYWAVAWSAHCSYVPGDPPQPFTFGETEETRDAYLEQRREVLEAAEEHDFLRCAHGR